MRLLLLAAMLALGLTPQRTEAFGFERQPTRWKRDEPIEFVINMANVPPVFSEQQMREVVQQALEPWAKIATANLPFRVGSVITDPSKIGPHADGMNVMYWETSAKMVGDMFAGKAYSFASECDIALEPRAPYTLIDLRAIVIHELGHCMGLAHSTAHSVMTKFQGLPAIGHDDIVAVSLLYPNPQSDFDGTTATVTGKVERNGKPLLGAVLRVVDVKTKRIFVSGFSGLVDQQRRKEASGRFELPGLPPGEYTLRVEPMDAFTAADPQGYGAPVEAPPEPFPPLSVEIFALEAGDVHDLGTLALP